MVAVAAAANKLPGTAAINRVVLTKVVCKGVVTEPAVHRATDVGVKLVPLMVTDVVRLSAGIEAGNREAVIVRGVLQRLTARMLRAALESGMKRGMSDADPAGAKLRLTVPVP